MNKEKFLEAVKKFSSKSELEILETEELYDICLEELKENFASIKIKYSSGDVNRIREDLHNIKGVAGSYLLDEVYDLANELSNYLTKNDEKGINNCLDSLDEKINELPQIMKEVFMELNDKS